MNNNDLHKNQPHAQALSDDDLENVAGGWREVSSGLGRLGFLYYPRYKLNKKERKILESLGYTIWECEINNDGGCKVRKDGRDINYDEMRHLFGNETHFW